MATVRFNRGHWVADYYDTNKRRRIERPKGHFENLTDELRAAQALLADRLAEVAMGWCARATEPSAAHELPEPDRAWLSPGAQARRHPKNSLP